jgi:serine/threonine-protein kinase HipA
MPRHFYQTGARAGLDEGTIRGLFAQIVADAPEAIRATKAGLPRWFPKDLANSIFAGFNSRLRLLELELGRFADAGEDDE